jgi:hypothetical protein
MKTVKINNIRTFAKDQAKPELLTVVINNEIYLSAKQLANAGYKNPKAAIGCQLSVEYYAVGDLLLDKISKCTKDNTLIKSFTIEDGEDDIRLAKMANAGVMVKF